MNNEIKTIYCYKDGKYYKLTDDIEETKGMSEIRVCDLDTLNFFSCVDFIFEGNIRISEGVYTYSGERIYNEEDGDLEDIIGYVKVV